MHDRLPTAFGRTLEPGIDFDPRGINPATGRAAAACANPLASWAAVRILQRGGSAIDAAISAQSVLSLVEPNASGLGGGAIIMLHTPDGIISWDGLSAAPSAAPDRITAETGGITIGTPGAYAALAEAHRTHGALPWSTLFGDAIALAEEGFPLSPYLARTIADIPAILNEPQAATLYARHPAGTNIRNPAFAATLRALAQNGAAELYQGETAHRIVQTAQADGGILTLADLAAYRPIRRTPIQFQLNGLTIHGAALPAYGTISAGQIASIALAAGMEPLGLIPTLAQIHTITAAGRLAQADRVPYEEGDLDPAQFLTPAYIAARAALLDPNHLPPSYPQGPAGSMTSHLSIADGRGQLLAMTTTINQNFGSRLAVGGFYLNNVMTNFATSPTRQGRPAPNRMLPCRRARTTIAPCLVLNTDGTPLAALGCGGGYKIIGYVANTLLRLAAGARNPQAILNAPQFLNWEGPTEIEPDLAPHTLALTARGHHIKSRRLDGGAQLLVLSQGLAHAAGDPRRDGCGMAVK
jgi:gamma-glutamyltranspeptidase/glutathione hydrolase